MTGTAAVLDDWRDAIRGAAESQRTLDIIGGGTKSFYGRETSGEPLRTTDHHGMTDYTPSELVITARAGTALATVESALAENGQMLAFEPPHFGAAASIGGMVASGLSGPRRPYTGAVRDSVLGVDLIDGNGELLHFGGRVMKNVAGYDASRLMAGALGTLGLLTSVSLRVLPQPPAEQTCRFELPLAEAHRRMLSLAREPWPISALACDGEYLRVRLSGHAAAVADAADRLGGSVVEGDDYWQRLREQALDFFAARPLWRISVPAAAPLLPLAGTWLFEWGGALRWLIETEDDAAGIRAAARSAGGHATLFRGDRTAPFAPLDAVNSALHVRLKRTFDPHAVFNRGRMYADF